jgi:hypothetical protein
MQYMRTGFDDADVFKANPGLTITSCQVQAGVTLADFQDLVSTLDKKPININDRNLAGLSQRSEEFTRKALQVETKVVMRRLADEAVSALRTTAQAVSALLMSSVFVFALSAIQPHSREVPPQ